MQLRPLHGKLAPYSTPRKARLPTLAVGLALFVLLQALKRLTPRVPAPLVAVVLGIGAVYLLGLDRR